jgi:hypothetical protein
MVQHNKTALVTGLPVELDEPPRLRLLRRVYMYWFTTAAQEAPSVVENIQSMGGRAEAIRADLATPEEASLLARASVA